MVSSSRMSWTGYSGETGSDTFPFWQQRFSYESRGSTVLANDIHLNSMVSYKLIFIQINSSFLNSAKYPENNPILLSLSYHLSTYHMFLLFTKISSLSRSFIPFFRSCMLSLLSLRVACRSSVGKRSRSFLYCSFAADIRWFICY